MTSDPAAVLDFWFGTDPSIRRAEWFEKSAAFDAACAAFLPAVRAARAQDRTEWGETAKGALALILLLDQFPRNLFRGSAEAFAADGFARIAATRRGGCRTCGAPRCAWPTRRAGGRARARAP